MWNRGIEAVGRESHIAFLNDDVRLGREMFVIAGVAGRDGIPTITGQKFEECLNWYRIPCGGLDRALNLALFNPTPDCCRRYARAPGGFTQ